MSLARFQGTAFLVILAIICAMGLFGVELSKGMAFTPALVLGAVMLVPDIVGRRKATQPVRS